MRKVLFVAVILLGLATTLWAAPAGAQGLANPAFMTPRGQFSLGLDVSYLFEQKSKDYDLKYSDTDGDVGATRYETKITNDQLYLLGLSYGLTDWLNVFAQAGVASGGKLVEPNSFGGEWEVTMKDQFVWAVGAKARAFKLDNGLALGLVARYLRYDDRKLLDWRENNSSFTESPSYSTDERMDYWQVDMTAMLSMPLGPLTPYVGLGYAHWEARHDGRWIYNTEDYSIDYESEFKGKDELLALCGLDLALVDGLSLYVQAEFVARTTLGLGLTWSF